MSVVERKPRSNNVPLVGMRSNEKLTPENQQFMEVFAESFVDDFDKVTEHANKSHKYTRDSVAILRKLQTAELEYAKKLEKIVSEHHQAIPDVHRKHLSKVEDISTQGSMIDQVNFLIEAAYQSSTIHERFANRMGTAVVEPLTKEIKEYELKRTSYMARRSKLAKELQDGFQALKLAQTKRDQAQKDYDTAQSMCTKAANNFATKDKERLKLTTKLERSKETIASVQVAFDMQEKLCRELQKQYYSMKMPDLLREVYYTELREASMLKNAFTALSGLLASRATQEKETIQCLSDALHVSKPEHDINNFIITNKPDKMNKDTSNVTLKSLRDVTKTGRMHLSIVTDPIQCLSSKWKEYCFALRSSTRELWYFEAEDSKMASGKIPIPESLSKFCTCDHSLFMKEHVMQIISNSVTHFLYLENMHKSKEWYEAIKGVQKPRTAKEKITVRALKLSVKEAKNLPKGAEYSVVLQLDQQYKTRTLWKGGTAVFWGQDFIIDELADDFDCVRALIYQQKTDVFGTKKQADYATISFYPKVADKNQDKWYIIPNAIGGKDQAEPPTIRVTTHIIEEVVHPMSAYTEIVDLMRSDLDAVKLLDMVISPAQREHCARAINYMYLGTGGLLDCLAGICLQEINSTMDPNVLFRGNSIATKMVDQFLKMVGMPFMHDTLQDLITGIYDNPKVSCEVDPTRLSNPNELKQNWSRLLKLMGNLWNSIMHCQQKCPEPIRYVLNKLRRGVQNRFPDEIVQYTVVSGFIFLRFFCPALLNPKLFGMATDHPMDNVARTLTLVAKTLQNLANLVQFGAKESYMKDMNNFITANQASMKRYIDDISSFRNDATPQDFPIDIPFTKTMTARHTATVVGHLMSNLEELKDLQKTQPSTTCDTLVNTLHPFVSSADQAMYESIYAVSKAVNMFAVAIFDYEASHSDEITLVRGMKVQVTSLTAADAGWWEVVHNGRHGLIPSTHARLLDSGTETASDLPPYYMNVEEFSRAGGQSQALPTQSAKRPDTQAADIERATKDEVPPVVPYIPPPMEKPPPIEKPSPTSRASSFSGSPGASLAAAGLKMNTSLEALVGPGAVRSAVPAEVTGVKGYIPNVTSKQAEFLLESKPSGTYIIRPRKTQVAAYAIAVRGYGMNNTDLGTKHFKLIVDPVTKNFHLAGRVHIKQHKTIASFVAYHQQVPLWDNGARLEIPYEADVAVGELVACDGSASPAKAGGVGGSPIRSSVSSAVTRPSPGPPLSAGSMRRRLGSHHNRPSLPDPPVG